MAWIPTIVSFNYLGLLFQCFTFDHFSITMGSDTTEIIEYFRNNTFWLLSNMTIIGTYFRQLGIGVKDLKGIIII